MILKFLKRKKARLIPPSNNDFANLNSLIAEISEAAKSKAIDRNELVQQHLALIAMVNNEMSRMLLRVRNTTFLISSLFLHESFNYLNQQEEESLHLITGPERGDIRCLERIIPVKLKVQTLVEASAWPEELRITFLRIDRLKYHLLGYFHIHPGVGADVTYPSSVDLRLQDKIERGGYEAIGGIFSRDGFLRFHAPKIPNIELFGKGAERINETLCHLSEIS